MYRKKKKKVKKRKKSFIRGKELSSANCLNLTQTSQVITAVLTSCGNRNSFHLSASVAYRLDGGGQWCFPRVSGGNHSAGKPHPCAGHIALSAFVMNHDTLAAAAKLLPLISSVTPLHLSPNKGHVSGPQ